MSSHPQRKLKSSISSKGQVTIPVEVRDRLGLRAGTVVRFELCDEGVLLRKGAGDVHPIDKAFGLLKLQKPVDAYLDEMRGPRPAKR